MNQEPEDGSASLIFSGLTRLKDPPMRLHKRGDLTGGRPAPEPAFYIVYEIPMGSNSYALYQVVPDAGESLGPEDADRVEAYCNGPGREAQSWMPMELRWTERGHPVPQH
jgi:hypothetical protein